MNISALTAATPNPLPDPAKVRDAGRQFESLLIAQLLQSARSSGAGWLGTPEGSSSDCATEYAEQQFAETLAQAGGIGIAHMVEQSLQQPAADKRGSNPP